jgi:hypothetical protein
MATPIHFAPGSYGAIINGRVSSTTGMGGTYSLAASANQLLTMIWGGGQTNGEGGGDPLRALVVGPDGNGVPDGNPMSSGQTIQLPLTGTYTITIEFDNMEERWDGTFTMCILVVKPSPPI